MNAEERIKAIRAIMDEEVFDGDKVERINDILNISITAAELSAAQDKSYHLGYDDGVGRIFYPMLFWGAVCGVAGYIIAFAVI